MNDTVTFVITGIPRGSAMGWLLRCLERFVARPHGLLIRSYGIGSATRFEMQPQYVAQPQVPSGNVVEMPLMKRAQPLPQLNAVAQPQPAA